MYLQLISTILMCFLVAHAMYKYGRNFKKDNEYKPLAHGINNNCDNMDLSEV